MAEVAADFPGQAMTTVISEAEDTLAVAASLGLVDTICQRDGLGLNRAVTQGCTELCARGAEAILILPVDLPQVLPADLREIATLGKRSSAIICPDRHMSGTNAIFLANATRFCFQFGVDSYHLHALAAEQRGLRPLLHYNARIACDVDTVDDLAALEGTRFAPTTMAAEGEARR
jgi:2-phospho-L-lactate guanylyltransferase